MGKMGNLNILELEKDQLFLKANESSRDLYYLIEGEVVVLVAKNSLLTPLAYIGANEFIGELSFFDGKARSAHLITTKNSKILKIPFREDNLDIPFWLQKIGESLSLKIRLLDDAVRVKGLKKSGDQEMKPLTPEQQKNYYSIIKKEEQV